MAGRSPHPHDSRFARIGQGVGKNSLNL